MGVRRLGVTSRFAAETRILLAYTAGDQVGWEGS